MPDLKPCPICGAKVKVHGPMDWKPTFFDPDSGGDPVSIDCKCGMSFSIGSYDYQETYRAWNRRAGEEDDHSICGATNLPCIRCNPGGCDNRKEGADNEY